MDFSRGVGLGYEDRVVRPTLETGGGWQMILLVHFVEDVYFYTSTSLTKYLRNKTWFSPSQDTGRFL